MDYEELKKRLVPWEPIYALERLCSYNFRRVTKRVLFFSSLIALVGTIVASLGLLFDIAMIAFGSPEKDITYGFMSSNLGKEILWRSGIDWESQKKFLSDRKSRISGDKFKLPEDRSVFHAYLKGLWESDAEFKSFILANHVTEEEFLGAATWTASVVLDASK